MAQHVVTVRPLDFANPDDAEDLTLPASAFAEVEPGETSVLEADTRSMTAIRRHWSGQASRMFWLQRARESVPASTVQSTVRIAHEALVSDSALIAGEITAGLPEAVREHVSRLVSEQLMPRIEDELAKALDTMPIDKTGKTGNSYGGMGGQNQPGAGAVEADKARDGTSRSKRKARDTRS